MSVVCFNGSVSLFISSNSTSNFSTRTKNSEYQTTSVPASILSYSSYSSRILGKKNWVRSRGRIYATSTDPDEDTNELPTKFYRENVVDSKNGGNLSSSFLSFLCPLLKLFSGGDPSGQRNYTLEAATSSLSTFARLPWGSRSLSKNLGSEEMTTLDPPKHLQLFEFEACPFCRRVREAITELDLSVEVYPCPKGSIRHREMVRKFGGKEQFPFLIDPNTGISMYESGEIVKYLFNQYGQGREPSVGLLERCSFNIFSMAKIKIFLFVGA